MLLFGRLQDVAGWRERTYDAPPATLFALKAELGRDDPGLAEALRHPGVKAALDKVIVQGDAPLRPGAEIAFMPPMSGG